MRTYHIFLFLILTCLLMNKVDAQTKVAVIIGVSDYPVESGIPDLKYPSQEAESVAHLLTEQGYTCYTFINQDATKANLETTFQNLTDISSQKSIEHLIFYFNGRGTRIEDDPVFSTLYFVDEDKDELDECILLSDANSTDQETYLRDDGVFEFISQVKSNSTTLILDCCFNGDPDNNSIKGYGNSKSDTLDGINIMKEGDVGALSNSLVLSASSPDRLASDGVFTPALIDALSAEETDISRDRDLSMAEIYAYLKNFITDQQTPYLFDPQQHNPTLATLPELSTLEVTSDPVGADVYLTQGQRRREYAGTTPFLQELKKGTYQIDVQKPAFRRSPGQKLNITEYGESYEIQPLVLKPIGIHGIVRDKNGDLPENLTALVKLDGVEIWRKEVGKDGSFHLNQIDEGWLKLDEVYEVVIIGKNLFFSEKISFTFRGFQDIDLLIPVIMDTTAPVMLKAGFSSSRIKPVENLLLSGDKSFFTLRVTDDELSKEESLGIKSVELSLGKKGTDQLLSLEPNKLVMSKNGEVTNSHSEYKFQYMIPENPDSIEEWFIAKVQLIDKGGNVRIYGPDEINITFSVCPSAISMAEILYDEEKYYEALEAFKLAKSNTDRGRYMVSLTHHKLNSKQKSLENFLQIEDPIPYMAGEKDSLPEIPREFANQLWRNYLDRLPDNLDDPNFFDLLAATAEKLNRSVDAELYRSYKEQYIANKQ